MVKDFMLGWTTMVTAICGAGLLLTAAVGLSWEAYAFFSLAVVANIFPMRRTKYLETNSASEKHQMALASFHRGFSYLQAGLLAGQPNPNVTSPRGSSPGEFCNCLV